MSNSQKPNTSDAVAGMLGIVKILAALENGEQISPEMVAAAEKVNGKMPPEVRQAVDALNLLHSIGINKKTVDAANAEKAPEVPPLADNHTTIVKDSANLLSHADEVKEVESCVLQFLDMWGAQKELSPQFPILVACSILFALGTSYTNDGGEYQMNILKSLDKTREHIVEDRLRKQRAN